MVTFLDGPAEGESLALRRIPVLLRVVRSRTGNWDALDQLDDEPKPTETITIYRRRDDLEVSKYHVRSRCRCESGFYWTASYSVLPEQPTDDQVRATSSWRAWATDALVAIYSPPVVIPFPRAGQEGPPNNAAEAS
jgi:hypothetical protein